MYSAKIKDNMDIEKIAKLKVLLKDSGSSITSPRLEVFGVLENAHSPLMPSEIFARLQKEFNLSSVYRNLDLLEKIGAIKSVSLGFKKKYEIGEIFRAHHHHAVCEKCKKSFAIEEERIERLIEDISKEIRFVPSSHNFEINGICKKC
jgi:Fur family transcriptional regulator, ferric uptake regulator